MSDTQIKQPLASDDLKMRLSTLNDRLIKFNERYAEKLKPLMLDVVTKPDGPTKGAVAVSLPVFPPLFAELRNMIIRIELELDKAEMQFGQTEM